VKITLLYIPTASTREARGIAQQVLAKKLASCANTFPISSLFLWKGKVQNDKEVVLLLKTSKNKLFELKKEVKKLHSYDVPCILELEAGVNDEYVKWMRSMCNEQ